MPAHTRGHTITRTAWARRRRQLADLQAQRRQRARKVAMTMLPLKAGKPGR